jgi:hypothetical protein
VENALSEPLKEAGYPEHFVNWRVGINQDPLPYDADGRANFEEIEKWFALTSEEVTNLQGLKNDAKEEENFLNRLAAGTDSIVGEVDWAKAYASVVDRELVEVAKTVAHGWNGYKIDSAAYSAVSSHYNRQFVNFELDAAFDRLAALKKNAYARLAETYVVAKEASGDPLTRDARFDLKPAVRDELDLLEWNNSWISDHFKIEANLEDKERRFPEVAEASWSSLLASRGDSFVPRFVAPATSEYEEFDLAEYKASLAVVEEEEEQVQVAQTKAADEGAAAGETTRAVERFSVEDAVIMEKGLLGLDFLSTPLVAKA